MFTMFTFTSYHKYKKIPYWIEESFEDLYSNKKLELISYNFVDTKQNSNILYRCINIGSMSVISVAYVVWGNHINFCHENYPYSILMCEIL